MKLARLAAFAALSAAGLGVLWLVGVEDAGNRDVVDYWSAARQLMGNHSPYDRAAIFALEQSVGLTTAEAIMVRNPPLFLPIILVLGWMPFQAAAFLWLAFLVACAVFSIHILRQVNDRTHLFGYLFVPVLGGLMSGQTGLLLLAGIALFFRFYRDQRPAMQIWAGAGLAAMLLKPHLFIAFGVAVCVWMVIERRYQMMAGLAGVTSVLTLLSIAIRPTIWGEYFQMIRESGLETYFIPTVSGTLRVLTGVPLMQAAPLAVACCWLVWYGWAHFAGWSWEREGYLVLTVSVLVAPYAWMTDEAVLLPVVFAAIYRSDRALKAFVIVNGIALAELLFKVGMPSGWYCWTPAAWLALYLYSLTTMADRAPAELSAQEVGS
jgi:hypothetical protein